MVMVSHNCLLMFAIGAICYIETVALVCGIDGLLLSGSIGGICAIVGVKAQQVRHHRMLLGTEPKRPREASPGGLAFPAGRPLSGIPARSPRARAEDARG
jgi:hypothetical protein